MEFYQTKMGNKFFNADFPRAVKALEAIAKNMESEKAGTQAAEQEATHVSPVNTLIKPCKEEVLALLDKDDDEDEFEDEIGAFAETIANEIATDDEDPARAARYMLQAYLDDDIDSFCVALCGWSMRSLLAKAKLIEDVEGVCVDE